ncbi:hypothetical protein C427_0438 [Paraglaciecola psychrophila 170]|uniref:Uncharacterized protein n=1 Tax=Paraglaciecola psychrophila 170 TaxID=1129794 RepID=M4RIZ2_9ALTE|nr:hypothetical protein C427_0438 [Paraglaciecola psychrophila 170]
MSDIKYTLNRVAVKLIDREDMITFEIHLLRNLYNLNILIILPKLVSTP